MKRYNGMQPRIGVVGLAYPGYNLGEEMCEGKLQEMVEQLRGTNVEVAAVQGPFFDDVGAARAGETLAQAKVDCILAVITTFVPDYFIVRLVDQCDVPVFLWAVEREMQCISVVCGPLITATLFNLGNHYRLFGADIPDEETRNAFMVFARAAMLRRVLRTMRVGYCGGKPSIMFSMETDEYAIKRKLGTSVVTIPVQDYEAAANAIPKTEAKAYWIRITADVGRVNVSVEDGLASSRYALAAQRLAETYGLDALSLNCFPSLKSRICLAVAQLNDAGIAAACEGDLHSTILMHLLTCLIGKASFNGDFLRMYPEARDVLFSHCGAGAFSLAARPCDVCLHASTETQDGLAVCYATEMNGPVTLLNLMHGPDGLRLAALQGEGRKTDLTYEGTPLRVHFGIDPREILDGIARTGAGHHWNGGQGHRVPEFSLLCEWLGVTFSKLT